MLTKPELTLPQALSIQQWMGKVGRHVNDESFVLWEVVVLCHQGWETKTWFIKVLSEGLRIEAFGPTPLKRVP